MKLRDYQEKLVASVESEFNSGTQSTLAVMPTGTGKTVAFSHIANRNKVGRVFLFKDDK